MCDILRYISFANDKERQKFKDKYLIEDVFGEKTRVFFILESPHSDEILCKLPAAGDTGFELSRKLNVFLNNANLPLGKIIHDNIDNSIFGIVNCCQIPMQESPYCFNTKFSEMLRYLTTIRNTKINVKSRKNEETQKWDNLILVCLNLRIKRIMQNRGKCLIIPCGTMANYFINKLDLKDHIMIKNVPHPAYKNWSKKKNRIKIKGMIQQIKELQNGKDN